AGGDRVLAERIPFAGGEAVLEPVGRAGAVEPFGQGAVEGLVGTFRAGGVRAVAHGAAGAAETEGVEAGGSLRAIGRGTRRRVRGDGVIIKHARLRGGIGVGGVGDVAREGGVRAAGSGGALDLIAGRSGERVPSQVQGPVGRRGGDAGGARRQRIGQARIAGDDVAQLHRRRCRARGGKRAGRGGEDRLRERRPGVQHGGVGIVLPETAAADGGVPVAV